MQDVCRGVICRICDVPHVGRERECGNGRDDPGEQTVLGGGSSSMYTWTKQISDTMLGFGKEPSKQLTTVEFVCFLRRAARQSTHLIPKATKAPSNLACIFV
jgi:hypothetical protein